MATDEMGPVEDLIQRALGGNREAFGDLVDRYRHQVYGVCWHALRHREDAEDAAQETFLQAFSHLHSLREPGRFPSWLRQIAVNVCKMRQRRAEPAPLSLAEVEEIPAPEPDPELRVTILEALNNLPENTRLPFVLRHIDGLSYEEIAEFLDTGRDTVRGRIYTARKRLQEELREMAEEFIRKEKLGPGFTRRVQEKLFWHEQPIEVTHEVRPEEVVLVYLNLFKGPSVRIKGVASGQLQVIGRKVLVGPSVQEAEGRGDQVRVVAQRQEGVFRRGPVDADVFAGVCWSDSEGQPVYKPVEGEWNDLKHQLTEFPELLARLETVLEGSCITVAAYNHQLAPIWLPPTVLTGEVKEFIGVSGWRWSGEESVAFCAAGGAEISLALPPCRTLVVIMGSGQEARLEDIHGDVLVLNPDLYARFSARNISGDLSAYGAIPVCLAGIGGDLFLSAPGYGSGGSGMWPQMQRNLLEERQVVIKDVRGKLHVEVTNLDLKLSNFGPQAWVKNSYGDIHARLSDYAPKSGLIFKTITGEVTLALPPSRPEGWHVALWSEGGDFECSGLTQPVNYHLYDRRKMYVGTLSWEEREKANLQVITGIGNVRLQGKDQNEP